MQTILVRFKPDVSREEIDGIIAGYGTVKRISRFVANLVTVTLKDNVDEESALAALNAHEKIDYAGKNSEVNFSTVPNDTYYPNNSATMEYMSAPDAWDKTTGSRDIIVAVIDTGCQLDHEDLKDNLWVDPYMYDPSDPYNDQLPIHGYDFVNDSWTPNDDAGHGTLIAGLIGAIGNNGKGVAGVCWNVRLMILKVSSVSDVIEAIHFAILRKADVINFSAVFQNIGYVQEFKDAIDAAGAAGFLS